MKKILLGALVAVVAVLGVGLLTATSAPAGAAPNCEVYGPDCPTPTPFGGGGGTTTTTVVGVSQHSTESTTTVAEQAHVEAATATANSPATPTAAAAANQESASLAFTGGDIAGMVAIAFCLVAVGLVVVRTSRRRTTD